MSWATCYSGSNNIHFNIPPLMSDGRHYTHYDPSCQANNLFRNKMNFTNNYDYRQWLINNGNRVADINQTRDAECRLQRHEHCRDSADSG